MFSHINYLLNLLVIYDFNSKNIQIFQIILIQEKSQINALNIKWVLAKVRESNSYSVIHQK